MIKLALLFSVLISTAGFSQNVIDLTKWEILGIGNIETDKKENAYKLIEGNNSQGLVLLSPEKYSKDLKISFDVKPSQHEGVCVVFFSAASSKDQAIIIPDNYNGNSDFWISAKAEVKSYAIAFHTGYHQPNLMVKKNPGWVSLGEIKDVVNEERWYKIDIIKKSNLITIAVDGKIVLAVEDKSKELLNKGHVGLRLKGPGNGTFAVLYKNMIITD